MFGSGVQPVQPVIMPKNKAPRCWEREGDEDVVASRETKPGRRDKLQSMIAWSLYRVVHKKGLQLSREKAGLAVPCSMFHVPRLGSRAPNKGPVIRSRSGTCARALQRCVL